MFLKYLPEKQSFEGKYASYREHQNLQRVTIRPIVPRQSNTIVGYFPGRALWADSVSLQMNTTASRDQFNPIRIGENLVVNYKDY